MGGKLTVSSMVGVGSTFSFIIPLDIQKNEDKTTPRQEQVIRPATAPPTGSYRLLLAEDDPINRMVATAYIERLGYQVDQVENGLQAIEALKKDTTTWC